MADDRPAEEVPDAIGRLTRDLEDLKTSLAYLATRNPVGTVEPTFLGVAKPGALLLHGQTISRTQYANLWKWVTDNGLSPSAFGVGDGSTTFVLPDLRGKATVGATVVDPVGKSFGSAQVTLTVGQMPIHNHGSGTTDWSDRTHIHGGNTDNNGAGSHGGHFPGSRFMAAAGPDLGLAAWNSGGSGVGGHVHHFTSATESQGHKHNFVSNNVGNNEPFFVVQPSYAINFMIWT